MNPVYHKTTIKGRETTFCGIKELSNYHVSEFNGDTIYVEFNQTAFKVKIGYSIRNPEDELRSDLGETIALGRAKKTPLFTVDGNELIDKFIIKRLLINAARKFAKDPGKYVPALQDKK